MDAVTVAATVAVTLVASTVSALAGCEVELGGIEDAAPDCEGPATGATWTRLELGRMTGLGGHERGAGVIGMRSRWSGMPWFDVLHWAFMRLLGDAV